MKDLGVELGDVPRDDSVSHAPAPIKPHPGWFKVLRQDTRAKRPS